MHEEFYFGGILRWALDCRPPAWRKQAVPAAVDPADFRPVIQLFAQAQPMAVREVAAAALVCITSPDDACQQLDSLFAGLPAAGRIANHNKVR